MSDHCAYPKCGKELTHVEGRKKKKYCDQNCNTKHWKMLHPTYKPKTKRLSLEEYKILTEQIKENNKPENKERILAERNAVPKEMDVRKHPLTTEEAHEPAPGTMAWFLKYGDK